jgi:hypothetical protein
MLDYVKSQLEAGHRMVTIMSVGGTMQVSLKAELVAADLAGIVARVGGMAGGLSEPRMIPWSSIAYLTWE